jgi:hypothetical protein
MKKEELNRAIRLEIQKILNENLNIDVVNRSLNLLDKAADMAIKNPTGSVIELAKIVKKLIGDIKNNI